jgi:hypothetical protein
LFSALAEFQHDQIRERKKAGTPSAGREFSAELAHQVNGERGALDPTPQ